MHCCGHFPVENLVAYVDGELSAAERAQTEEHLALCTDCTRDLDLLRRSGDLIAALPGLEPSTDFSDRVVSAARGGTGGTKPRRGRLLPFRALPFRALPATAAAAAVVVGILAGGWWLGNRAIPVDDGGVLTAAEEQEIARDLLLLSNLDALEANEPDALVSLVEDLDVVESLELGGDGQTTDGEDGG